MNGCPFCPGLSDDPLENLIVGRVITGTEALLITPTLGPLTDDHLLIVPRAHIPSLGCLSDEGRHGAEVMASAVGAGRAESGRRIMFEHGMASEDSDGGCGIVHAHLHVVLVSPDVRVPPLPDACGAQWHVLPASGWAGCLPTGADYLLVADGDEAYLATGVRDVPSQYLRRWLGDALEVEWDWRARRSSLDCHGLVEYASNAGLSHR